MKPISRKLTISIKDPDKGTELGTLTAEFDLPTDYTEINDGFNTPVLVAPRVNDVEFQSNISRALTAAAEKLGE
ncbi:hypothetical protein J3U01_09685 [Bifidobacterium sp. B4107]|uniref:hypothetical protein n=1 Tax=unclassified Bifidobacterium TaxID=2608897 RepID=UPI00226B6923|nr:MULTISPECIES: hypothetical protein [unclassified Bifidobacterium]MCX8648671.1 hypothetical protein [Bifidobacterium sp. B4107]MCX8652860.1 hypothetical protein [Bifidobacterium sp. B4111]MCX8659287.1 hypothetical protein [Bifidobacterium sp. B4114]